ncbi:hypothetical protein MKW94_017785 [Papaver nudicaule]|uniref:GBF-interacting protein 1 N-terminal domain-containing protein n=1 Tax=Papaver nudicaule TaxID=74823 RepID=A0AA41W218_PAPNU|nr:hypothetical protein [Papaver nudicaule]
MSGGTRVSIPNNVKKIIQNIKEIAGNHSDDEIYAMLKECSMDPNETTQKLLFQDTFHEVRRKRDKKPENLSNREPADSRWRPGPQGRAGRGGRGNHSTRHTSHDAGGRTAGKEYGVSQNTEKGVTPASKPPSQHVENKVTNSHSSSVVPTTDGPNNAARGIQNASAGHGTYHFVENSVTGANKLGSVPPPLINTEKAVISAVKVGTAIHELGDQRAIASSNHVVPAESKLIASQNVVDHHHQVDEVVSHDASVSQFSSLINEKTTSEVGNSFMLAKIPSKFQGDEKSQILESSQPSSSATHGGVPAGRPSSSYATRSQQLTDSQKAVGPIKEWKPKPTTPNPVVVFGAIGTYEAGADLLPTVGASSSETTTSNLQKKLQELHVSHGQHVIIPDHLQVAEAERPGLSFGSFDANFVVNTSYGDFRGSNKSPTPLSETFEGIEEAAEDRSSSIQNVSPNSDDGDYHNDAQSPTNMPESSSPGDVENAVPEYDHSKPEMTLPPVGPHYSVVHTAPAYSTFGLMPPMLGTQFAPFDSSEPQARDVSRLPGFVTGNSMVLSTAGPTPLVTQAAGVMQSSVPMTQQSVPVFRQPAGVLSHYPPNYIPHSQFFSPFYVPPPTIHHFLSNPAFPQQPPTGSVYPSPAAGSGIKYSFPHFKPGTNTGNSAHIGIPTGYGPYSSSSAGYGPSPATAAANSNGSEDRSAPQSKENNVYISGQQSEGSAVWVPAPSRDISGMQTSSFYNLSPQGQHVTFTPQGGHSAFGGVYHPAQTVSAATVHPLLQQSQTMSGGVEMLGPTTGIYQQPQRAPINWTNNY